VKYRRMKRYSWKVKPISSAARHLAKIENIDVFLAQVLINRDIKRDQFRSFLNPNPKDLHNPFLLPDIEKAVKRINDAIKGKEKVIVFGDYDVDGVVSLAIFHEFAKEFDGIFSFYIPHRVKEGYGLNKEIINKAKKDNIKLIIAFDCGTNSYEEIELAESFGIDVIVVDHHCPSDRKLGSFAFINPKRKDSIYPFLDLSAGALSFKLLQALRKEPCSQVLDLVALSLVCDVVPLRGENRTLLKEGISVIKKSKRVAIKALCKVSGIKQQNIDIFHIGYILGPRINASGRIAHAEDSLKLFLTDNSSEAEAIASKLSEYNKLRKGIEKKILQEADQRLQNVIEKNQQAIVVSGDNWHVGVLGIVASRLADKYCRPSFVISFDDDAGVGSARSIEGLHLIDILDKCSESLLLYGGHRKAAGIHIAKHQLSDFREKVSALIEEHFSPEDFIPALNIDAQIPFDEISMDLVENLEKLKPHGEGNHRPLFVSREILKKTQPKKINSYYSVWLSDKKRTYEGMLYDKNLVEILKYADSFEIVFSLEKNTYHNIPRLVIRDCRL